MILSLSVESAPVVGCDTTGGCKQEILTELPSPDGELRAVVFQRSCGATTGYSTQVSLLRKGSRLPNNGGNVFVADVPPIPGENPEIDVRWSGGSTLTIRYRSGVQVFKSARRVEGVNVVYGDLASAGG